MMLSLKMGVCRAGLEVCLCVRIWTFDILVPLLEKAAEFIVLVYLIQRQEYKWAFMMGITMLLPGFIESIYWIASCFCGEKDANCHKCCQWIFFYNPFLFPFTSIAW